MDVLEELESIALLTGGGSEIFKKVDALVNHLMTQIHPLKDENAQLQSKAIPPTPLGGLPDKKIEFCRCDESTSQEFNDCGCAFGQCAKGMIY